MAGSSFGLIDAQDQAACAQAIESQPDQGLDQPALIVQRLCCDGQMVGALPIEGRCWEPHSVRAGLRRGGIEHSYHSSSARLMLSVQGVSLATMIRHSRSWIGP